MRQKYQKKKEELILAPPKSYSYEKAFNTFKWDRMVSILKFQN